MYVAGSWTPKDFYDDAHLLPFKQTRNATRYQVAHDALMQHPQVTAIRGHSLGGSVALEVQKNYPSHIKSTITYGAPVLEMPKHINNIIGGNNKNVERYRNRWDPISSLDWGANNSVKRNPLKGGVSLTHDYSNIADKFNSSKQVPISSDNPDGSTSLIG